MVIYPLDSLCKLFYISNTVGYSFGIVLWSSVLCTLCVNCYIFITTLAMVWNCPVTIYTFDWTDLDPNRLTAIFLKELHVFEKS